MLNYNSLNKENIVSNDNIFFNFLVILPNKINHIDWNNIDYPNIIANLDIYKTILCSRNTFIDILGEELNIQKFDIKDFELKSQIIYENKEYLYEILYIDFRLNQQYCNTNALNEVATLLNLNGDKIFHNAIIIKNYLSVKNTSTVIENIHHLDIKEILYNRVNTNIVTWDWDAGWKEFKQLGELHIFANTFFEERNFKKIEIAFLMYNINIWYIDDNLGDKDICGNLLSYPLEKCIWFTLINDDIRGSLFLDEVKMIIKLSQKLEDYKTPPEYNSIIIGKDNKKIIYTKYRVLSILYNRYCN